MALNDENTKLLKEIRDLLADRERLYEKYLDDTRKEYEKFTAQSKAVSGNFVAPLSIWLFVIMFSANLVAGYVMK